jgi:integrase
MFNPNYLSLSRHNVYYLRFPIPVICHPEGRATDLKVSLGTRDPRQALSISRFLVEYGQRLLNHKTVVGMNYQELRHTLQEHFTGLLNAKKEKLLLSGRLSESDKQACKNTIEFTEDSIKRGTSFLEEYDPDFYKNGIAKFIDKHKLTIVPESDQHEIVTREYKIFYRDFCRAILGFDASFDNASFDDTPAKLYLPDVAGQSSVKLAQAVDDFIADRLSKKRTDARTAKGYRAELDLLTMCLGNDAFLPFGRKTGQNVLAMLMKVPKNRNNYPDYKIEELMELDPQEHKKLSLKTVKKYLSHYSAFYEWASLYYDQDFGKNPFSELQKELKFIDDDAREPFNPTEISLILNALLTDQTSLVRKPHHKWGTLIAIYTGARRNEIAQLEIADIQELDEVLCFDINEESKYGLRKSLKTKNSKRIIPVHSDLIKYGFLDYVASIKQEGYTRLFPELSYDASEGGYGRALGRWVNEVLLPHLSIKRPNVVFHSFRHTINYKLHAAGVSAIMVNYITGHEREGTNQKYYMTQGYGPKYIQAAIEQVKYP